MARFIIALIVALAGGIAPAAAQTYPTRPVHIVVPAAAGGGADIVARLLAEFMQNALKQPVVVDNKPGAAQLLGVKFVAKAPADGYTLLLTPSISGFPPFMKDPGVEIARDFEFISLVMQAAQIFAVNAKLPVKSFADLAAMSQANPDKLNFSSYGQLLWLQTAIVNRAAGIKATHIPFSSAADAARAVANGAADFIVGSLTPMRPFVNQGQIKLLSVTTNKRDPNIPDVPSLQEAGLKMDDLTVWIALLAPKGTPQPIVQRLNGVVASFTKDAGAGQKMRAMGFEPTATSPEQFRAMFVAEENAMTAIGKELGIKPE